MIGGAILTKVAFVMVFNVMIGVVKVRKKKTDGEEDGECCCVG